MVRLVFLSFLLLAASKVAFGQECTAEVSTNWTTCLFSNLDSCTNCNRTVSNPTSGTPTCASITNEACPAIKCCRVCEAATYDFYQKCNVDALVQLGILDSCTLDCSAFPYGDTNVNNTTPCLNEYGSWLTCLVQDGANCDNCQASNITAFNGQVDTCSALETLVCDQISCCQGCRSQAQAYLSCAYTEYGNPYNCSSLGNNCTSRPTAPIAPTSPVSTPTDVPTSLTTPAPSATTPTTPAPSATTPTTPAPSATTPRIPAPSEATPTTPAPSVAPAAVTPTAPTPTDSSSPCSSEEDSLEQCFESNLVSCTATCASVVLNLNQTATPPKSCQAANDLVCPLYTCCPSCSSQVRAVFNCQIGVDSNLSGCVLSCGGSNTPTSGGGNGSKTNNTTTSGAANTMSTTKWWSVPVMAMLVFVMLTNVAML